MRTCAHCQTSIEGKRANARFCSTSCRVMTHRNTTIPRKLTERSRWVRWKYQRRRGDVSKPPVQVDGTLASSTDPGTWTSFAAAAGSSRGEGLGFVLGDGIGCIDLDHCLVDGKLNEPARRVLDALPATYAEISPSGDGLHLWFVMAEAPGRVLSIAGQRVEVYSRGRYMTITGHRFGSVPGLARLGPDWPSVLESL